MRFIQNVLSHWRLRHARRILKGYIDPKLIQKYIDDPDYVFARLAPQHRQLDFILALVRDDNLDELPALLQRIAEAVPMSTGHIDYLTGPLIVITCGFFKPDPEAPQQRLQIVTNLRQSLANNIKLLHGRSPALIGRFGDRFPIFGSLLQNFSAMLQTLTTLEYGETREWDNDREHKHFNPSSLLPHPQQSHDNSAIVNPPAPQ